MLAPSPGEGGLSRPPLPAPLPTHLLVEGGGLREAPQQVVGVAQVAAGPALGRPVAQLLHQGQVPPGGQVRLSRGPPGAVQPPARGRPSQEPCSSGAPWCSPSSEPGSGLPLSPALVLRCSLFSGETAVPRGDSAQRPGPSPGHAVFKRHVWLSVPSLLCTAARDRDMGHTGGHGVAAAPGGGWAGGQGRGWAPRGAGGSGSGPLTRRTRRPCAECHARPGAGARGPAPRSRTAACPWRGTRSPCCTAPAPPRPAGGTGVGAPPATAPRSLRPWAAGGDVAPGRACAYCLSHCPGWTRAPKDEDLGGT